MKPSLVFFGSFQHYSTKILKAIVESTSANVLAVVTTPNENNPTHKYAKSVNLPTLAPTTLTSPIPLTRLPRDPRQRVLRGPDFFVVAGYGNILPQSWLEYPTIAPLNLHFSLLPKYRGANPAEWAILSGETETGVTLIKMDAGLDTGPIIMQESISIEQPVYPVTRDSGFYGDNRETLYEKLYSLAGKLIVEFIINYQLSIINSAQPQPLHSPTPYARRFTRADGFIPYPEIVSAMETGQDAVLIERKVRALYGYPGVWTTIQTPKGAKRLKILSAKLVPLKIGKLENWKIQLNEVQLEGLNPSTFAQIKNQLYPSKL